MSVNSNEVIQPYPDRLESEDKTGSPDTEFNFTEIVHHEQTQ